MGRSTVLVQPLRAEAVRQLWLWPSQLHARQRAARLLNRWAVAPTRAGAPTVGTRDRTLPNGILDIMGSSLENGFGPNGLEPGDTATCARVSLDIFAHSTFHRYRCNQSPEPRLARSGNGWNHAEALAWPTTQVSGVVVRLVPESERRPRLGHYDVTALIGEGGGRRPTPSLVSPLRRTDASRRGPAGLACPRCRPTDGQGSSLKNHVPVSNFRALDSHRGRVLQCTERH